MKKRRLLGKLTALAAVSLVFLTACQNQEASEEDSAATDSSSDQETEVLRFGITGGYPPSNYHDEDTEELVGYEVDMAKELVKDLDGDVKAEFVEMSFGSILESLNSDRIDVAMHSLSETPERAEQYDFTVPYFDKVWGVIVAEDSDIQTLDDLDGKRAAQSVSTSSGQEAEKLGGELVPIDDVDEAMKLITEDRADFYLGSDVGQQDYLDKQPEPLSVRVLDETVPDVPASLVVPKGSDELREDLNEVIIENTEDGTLAEIYDEYLGMDKSIEDFDEYLDEDE
ncbi:transporter substrate-binding domain-containing protein [Tetragenococcus halophilus]|uniref:Transporter substrate-binding domain-containing protein n=1 Tax=Tetragenococcus halophilus TaxID=51669 RepID=A0AB37D6T5_TETHA|nr:transporter substrate-binding domain-containing protein [Tetragenococcus halophilus]AOF49217.1 hypothetical protein AC806_07375 [Tetragenococcus halophilus]MCF1685228.1 transporter substrate-binding domain-containing protein [Tetragenococcus halophilus]MCO8286434.1 transporter substrate-binding domain-containing protein [Tetragenococcus halophilus]MCO8293746.1 transporter substrate-binding domain-containing protein [Tetragenococcus halophilus]MDN6113154.1 transporter substrate-binding domai